MQKVSRCELGIVYAFTHTSVSLDNEVVGTQFAIVHNELEDPKKGKVVLLPSVDRYLPLMSVPHREVLSKFLATFGQLFDDGSFNIREEGALNEIFPEIKPLKIQQALEAAARGA